MIYRYDAIADTWNLVQAGPGAAVGRRNISFFEIIGGEFYWGNDGTSDLHYTVGGAWNQITSPTTISSGSDYDPNTGILYVRTYRERGFFAFDPASVSFPTTCSRTAGSEPSSKAGSTPETGAGSSSASTSVAAWSPRPGRHRPASTPRPASATG
jgi:hypothetical protein